MNRRTKIDDIDLNLAQPDDVDLKWIGNDTVRNQLLAAWMVIDKEDVPLSPRLIGKPGVGKTTLAYSVGKDLERDVYIMQCTMDTRPEDLIITPVLAGDGNIAYHASPLVTAMINGGICVLDEGNRMSEKSWASLAPLLDRRRYVESVITGLKIKADKNFRICVTMNDDSSTFDLPEYIQSRLQPQIEISYPSYEEEEAILRYNIPFTDDELLGYVADFLQKAHAVNLPFTSRDGVNILRYALKLGNYYQEPAKGYLSDAIQAVLGDEGIEFLDTGLPSQRMSGTVRETDEEIQELADEFGADIEDFFSGEEDEEEDEQGY